MTTDITPMPMITTEIAVEMMTMCAGSGAGADDGSGGAGKDDEDEDDEDNNDCDDDAHADVDAAYAAVSCNEAAKLRFRSIYNPGLVWEACVDPRYPCRQSDSLIRVSTLARRGPHKAAVSVAATRSADFGNAAARPGLWTRSAQRCETLRQVGGRRRAVGPWANTIAITGTTSDRDDDDDNDADVAHDR